tara:strand:+ start:631 stop:801 length:171 start_codon:yes stop_codon:yes gene_type:complete
MDSLKRIKRARSNNMLFNPYKNGISSYDLAFLSSKKVNKSKKDFSKNNTVNEYFAA